MMVDGAAADTESLQNQAAETASRTLGASLGSDSPYLVRRRCFEGSRLLGGPESKEQIRIADSRVIAFVHYADKGFCIGRVL
jgi:hypothetical protein